MKRLLKMYQHALIDHHVEVEEEEGGSLFSALTIIIFASIATVCWFLL